MGRGFNSLTFAKLPKEKIDSLLGQEVEFIEESPAPTYYADSVCKGLFVGYSSIVGKSFSVHILLENGSVEIKEIMFWMFYCQDHISICFPFAPSQ